MACMQKFDFNRPFNVTLIVEDLEIDQYQESIGTLFNKLCNNTNTQDNANNKPPPMTFRNNAEREYINRSNNIPNENRSPINNIHNQRGRFIDAPNENVTLYKRQLIYTLDRLSESIIKVANSFHNIYKRFPNVSYQNDRVSKEITLKKQEFYNTLSTIATSIILMQEKNYVFIKKFIRRTVEIARLKSFYHITSDIVNYFIVDLINWRKNQSPRLEIGSKTRHPLSQVTKTIYKTRTESKRRKNELNSVRLFSYGSSDNQITLDIDSQLFNRIVNSKNTECEPTI